MEVTTAHRSTPQTHHVAEATSQVTGHPPAGQSAAPARDAAAAAGAGTGQTLTDLQRETAALKARLGVADVDPFAGPARAGDPAGAPRALTAADMVRIRRDYQVSDDPAGMVSWKPTGATGWLADHFGGKAVREVRVTAGEAKLLDTLGPLDLKAMSDIRQNAFAEAERRLPSQAQIKGNDDHTDAFRHAFWSARMAQQFGGAFAENYGTAHERVPGNTPNREAMDLHNNEVGRRIARENPWASESQLGDLIQQGVRDGKMVVLDVRGDLVPSNAVKPDQTGHEASNARALPGVNPALAGS